MMAETKAPKTLNRRISSLSSFYKYLAGASAELRLPINVPNPAHAQFIARESSDPLGGTRVRQLMGLPSGDEVLDFRDRAILKTYLYTGIRLATACRLRSRIFIWTANRPPSPSTRKAISTAPSVSISLPPRR
jgi:site-specific recombinase XerD